MNKKRITSKELAKLAGVSLATVSRAFSPTARISKATREMILSAAREHNYQPNAIARTLHSNRSRLVAIVVNTMANPCEAEELDILVHRLQDRQLLPIVLCCAAIEDRLPLMRLASTYQVDHVVVFSDMLSANDAFEIFTGLRPIMVTFEPHHHPNVDTVEIDGGAAAEEIVQKLVADGRRHFAYLGGRKSSWIDQKRQGWFAAALESRGLRFEAFGRGDYTYDAGFKESIMLLRRHKIDALICGNDVMAVGTCDAAERVLGRRIPEELAVVGQDGISMAAWECHDLTTLSQDHVKFIDSIMELIEQDSVGAEAARQLRLCCTVRWGATA
ncbi:MAG: LacI family DNA-binding transcriptional regulator [Albidovulum sp.]|nr:LacI family DNA-binding transcriptional regulator [Albidovulum sp.]MDE0534087.1 LacI family DNA-binding transcriptional regulator [Albidovulum sp.]